MTWRIRLALGLLTLVALTTAPGCSNRTPATPRVVDNSQAPTAEDQDPEDSTDLNDGILTSVVKLIRDAATNEGGDNFNIATQNLNAYFHGTKAEDFSMSKDVYEFLQTQLTNDAIKSILRREFIQREDGRHIEDTLLYHDVAVRVAGEGDDLTRATRLFDWVVRHAMLVPAGSLAPPGIAQAQARPYDVMLRGMGTEDGAGWSERGWLFMVLCRQVGIDAGLVTFMPPRKMPGPMVASRPGGRASFGWVMLGAAPPSREPKPWAVAILSEGKPYLFDLAIGLPIPSPDGKGVATLEEAITNPRVLAQLDIPGKEYEPTQPDLARGSFRILLETSLGTLAPRMKLFQDRLSGKNKMVLYRDPLAQAQAFKDVMGNRCSAVGFWALPLSVEHRLFNPGPGNFIEATLFPLQIFEKRWPMLSARLMQLRGETKESIQSYVVLRLAESGLQTDGKTPIPPQVQAVLDIFSTYFLALAQTEKGDNSQAKRLFGKTMEMLPEPDPRLPYFAMFRWGAATNLGLMNAEDGNHALAIRYLSLENPTLQATGNLLRARKLIFQDPFVPLKETPKVIPSKEMPAMNAPPAG